MHWATGRQDGNSSRKEGSKTAVPAEVALAKGEKYRGITLHEGKAHHLIELPGEFVGTHAEALAWAKEQGGELPSRIDGIVLFDGAKADYKREWYWLAPQHAGGSGCAWVQGFGYGYQGWTDVSSGITPARSADRPFSNSPIRRSQLCNGKS
jgi:hypothetical protein